MTTLSQPINAASLREPFAVGGEDKTVVLYDGKPLAVLGRNDWRYAGKLAEAFNAAYRRGAMAALKQMVAIQGADVTCAVAEVERRMGLVIE